MDEKISTNFLFPPDLHLSKWTKCIPKEEQGTGTCNNVEMYYRNEKNESLVMKDNYFNIDKSSETSDRALFRRIDSSSSLSMTKSPNKRRMTISGWQDIKCVLKKRRISSVALPTKFLLGGNINDPLNLKSLDDEKGTFNPVTPASSPLPVSQLRTQVEIMIPPNIYDPLNLNTGEEIEFSMISPRARKRKRHRRINIRRDLDVRKELEFGVSESFNECANTKNETECSSEESVCAQEEGIEDLGFVCEMKNHVAEIPESVLSETLCSEIDTSQKSETEDVTNFLEKAKNASSEKNLDDKIKVDKIVSPVVPQGSKFYKRTHSQILPSDKNIKKSSRLKKKTLDDDLHIKPENYKFSYGSNPHRYHCNKSDDVRFKFFRSISFSGKDVLDIGCNVGCMTTLIAENYQPRKIVGIDIDQNAINAAQQHLLQHLNCSNIKVGKFPSSFSHNFGPLSRILLPLEDVSDRKFGFPHNVSFMQENYLLNSDDDLEVQQPEFDIILCLRVTKWIHLNAGDSGLKRSFKRMFAQLRYGGNLILEYQPWKTYAHAKKLSETAHNNYNNIQFKPQMFISYLLSKEVGFSSCKLLGRITKNKRGHMQSLYVLSKIMNFSPGEDMPHCQDISPIVFNDIEWARHLEDDSDNSCEWENNVQSADSSAGFISPSEDNKASCYDLSVENEIFFEHSYFFPSDFDSNQDIY